jgi:hypothetical protein
MATLPVLTGAPHRRVLVLALVIALLSGVLAATPAAAAEYEMATHAGYLVDDDAGKVAVTVEIAFTNTFAPPAGQVSLFRTILVAIHDHASTVIARDSAGPINVAVAVTNGVNVATITPRTPVTYGTTANMTLTYELVDGADPAIRVGPHLVSFPAWGFGTQSDVRVDLAADYDVRVDGDPLEATVEDGRTILTSGAIDDPTHWLAHVGATREPEYATIQDAIPLDGGTADLQVRHWTDDKAWGLATMDLVTEALPRLERAFGFPYPARGPLVITESVTAGGPDSATDDGELAVGFAEPPFTVLHQVGHVWAGEAMGGDRWLLEGLASWAAGTVSTEMEIALPYDPNAVAESLKANAFPLADWGADDLSTAAEGWAYAAAWTTMNQAAEMVGPEAFQAALERMAAGLNAYDPLNADTDTPPADPPIVTSRAFLDHLDAVSDQQVVEALAGAILGETATAELADRTAARTAYDGLLAAAGDWGDPDPVRAAMVDWRFSEAMVEISDAGEWLVGRDALLAEIEAAGLSAPDRLRAAYEVHGGGTQAWAEIDAEQAVVDAYSDAADAVEQEIGPIARIGLLFGPSPEERLANAATAFAAGDLRVAADEITALNQDLATATASGLVRLLGIIVAVGAAALLATLAIRRRRSATDYTPEP